MSKVDLQLIHKAAEDVSVALVGTSSALAITTNLEVKQIITIAILSAIAYVLKDISIYKLKGRYLKFFLSLPYALLMPISVTIFTYFIGSQLFNKSVIDIGHPVWVAASMIIGLNYKVAVDFVADFISSLSVAAIEIVKNRFNKGVSNEAGEYKDEE